MHYLYSRCDDSLKSVREGSPCPANQAEWDERSKEMKCENLTQNCSEKNNFVYHCLINAWRNDTIEVCAPEVSIPGRFCAEFNKGGARVQTQYRAKCDSCPIIYKSSESYKYQECYVLQKTPEMSTEPQISEKVSLKNRNDSHGGENHYVSNTTDGEGKHGSGLQTQAIAAISGGIAISILLFLSFVFHFKLQRHHKSENTTDECVWHHFIPRNQGKSYADKNKKTEANQFVT